MSTQTDSKVQEQLRKLGLLKVPSHPSKNRNSQKQKNIKKAAKRSLQTLQNANTANTASGSTLSHTAKRVKTNENRNWANKTSNKHKQTLLAPTPNAVFSNSNSNSHSKSDSQQSVALVGKNIRLDDLDPKLALATLKKQKFNVKWSFFAFFLPFLFFYCSLCFTCYVCVHECDKYKLTLLFLVTNVLFTLFHRLCVCA